jgi:fructuronate reductase
MDRLSNATLPGCSVRVPEYRRDEVTASVVHLGLGAFARAHVCTTLDDLIAGGAADAGVLGVSLRHRDVPDALHPQDGLYTLGAIDGDRLDLRIIGSVLDVVHAPSEPLRVREALAAATTTIVSLTVTEKGYCWEPSTRRLDRNHADIVHDLQHPTAPRTVLGHLALAAADRRHLSSGRLTVLSLDNIPSNGSTLASLLHEFVAEFDPSLAGWIDEQFAFPCSMVDRMVPATDDGLRAAVDAAIGMHDAWPVRAERFTQWVVERNWATPMPALEAVGVQVVDDVAPWEALKLRVLNALHTVAAHHGLRYGLATVAEVIADPAGREVLRRVAAEIREVLVPPARVDVDDYIATTFGRFANSGLGHRCAQIATDSSQKLPQRLLVTLAARCSQGLASAAILDALALWGWSTLGLDHDGEQRVVNDPLAAEYGSIARAAGGNAEALANGLVALRSVFGDDIDASWLAAELAPRLARLLQ